ncbi:M56 family metallopeptidase [Massilia soli]|uniref:DUF3471 domain-containing protein n=1 Tax=Massilia soli TaxID=2792854 RepID=A0ABS7SPF6_9BURK|nr:M56 family metallopeptidase [Massilia soli]MBZ2208028.1 DUF3471 domain-containing protein [Massilia soli]
MIAWLAYTVMVTLLLAGAALAAEGSARLRRVSTRWIWALAIVAAPLLPLAISTVSIQVPASLAPGAASAPVALREATLPALSPSTWIATPMAGIDGGMRIDDLLQRAWAAASLAIVIALAAGAIALQLRKRRWAQRAVAGAIVLVAPDAGPAVVGLVRPRIVVPEWLLQASPLQQSLVIAHEKSHVDARDPQLLAFAIAVLALMPWNLPLWWMVRRLRHAIEVDCDARVLLGGHDVRAYGEVLVDVGQRQSGYLGAAAAMAESRSLLEQRIRLMLRAPGRKGRAVGVVLGGVALSMAAIAAQVAPPAASVASLAPRQQVDLPASRLVDYEGTYQVDEFILMEVRRDGRRLWTQMTGNPPIEQYAERQDAFFSRDIDAQLAFERDARGAVTGLVLHSLGAQYAAPKLEQDGIAAASMKINQNIVRTAPRRPDGEALLKRNIDLAVAGKLRTDEMTPQLAKQAQRMFAHTSKELAAYGRARAVAFLAVDGNGFDVYRVQHEHGQRDWHLLINSDGKVSRAYSRDAQ